MALVLAPATLGRGDSVSASAVDTPRRELTRDKRRLGNSLRRSGD